MADGTGRDAADVTTYLTHQLVKQFAAKNVSPGVSAQFEQKMTRYAMTILGSHIQSSRRLDVGAVSSILSRKWEDAGRPERELRDLLSMIRRVRSKGSLIRLDPIVYMLQSVSAAEVDRGASSVVLESMRWAPAPASCRVPAKVATAEAVKEKAPNVNPDAALEDALLRDVIYCLQGVDGDLVRLDEPSDSFAVSRTVAVSPPKRALVAAVTEAGQLYRRLHRYVKGVAADNSAGLVTQAFASGIREELSEYHQLIAVLESHASAPATQEHKLTLRRLRVWMHEPLQRLRLLTQLVADARAFNGGGLASAIHRRTFHGDAAVQAVVGRVMRRTSAPVFEMMRKWMYDGVLADPFDEFFVAAKPAPDDRLWQDRYSMRSEMVPAFIDEALAADILTTGKALNFIRLVCEDAEWVLDSNSTDMELQYGSEESMQAAVSRAASQTQKRLLELMYDEHKLLLHARGIKRYMLLGQGDFATHLMDMLEPELTKPPHQVYNHNLSGILESSVRASNAQYDDTAVLGSLDAMMLTTQGYREGWDVFSLSYHVASPINIMFTTQAMKQYQRVFNYIWRLKRVSRYLAKAWGEEMAANKWSRTLQEQVPQSLPFFAALHEFHLLRADMYHFVKQLEYVYMFEVLECAWVTFEKDANEAKDFDQVLASHNRFLEHITTRILLRATDGSSATGEGGKRDEPLGLLRQIWDNMLRFRKIQQYLYKVQKQAMEMLMQHRRVAGSGLDTGVADIAESIARTLQVTPRTQELFDSVKSLHKTLKLNFIASLDKLDMEGFSLAAMVEPDEPVA